jgi:hypothetical protein
VKYEFDGITNRWLRRLEMALDASYGVPIHFKSGVSSLNLRPAKGVIFTVGTTLKSGWRSLGGGCREALFVWKNGVAVRERGRCGSHAEGLEIQKF